MTGWFAPRSPQSPGSSQRLDLTAFSAFSALIAIVLSAAPAAAGILADGTSIRVRLVGVINTDHAKTGDPLEFVVMKDVVIGDQVLIARGARVAGRIVKAQRGTRGWRPRHAKLAFEFTSVQAWDGEPVRLRRSPITIDRDGRHHDLQWVSDGDFFEAFVEGDYEL